MNSNLSYSRETLNSDQNRRFFVPVILKFDGWPWETIGHLFYAASSFAHHSVAISEFKLKLRSETPNLGEPQLFFLAAWPWNLTENLENQLGTYPKQHQALCVISSSYVNSNWSCGPETAKLGFDLCDFDIWPLTSTFCMDITSVNGNYWWKFHDDMMTRTLWKRCDGRKNGRTDGQTDRKTKPFLELLGRS